MPLALFQPFSLSKEWILGQVREEDIFLAYLGLPVTLKRKFCNPLRSDHSPGCEFRMSGGKVQFTDWSQGFSEDCFGIVMKRFNLNFHSALSKIALDFGLIDSSGRPTDKSISATTVLSQQQLHQNLFQSAANKRIETLKREVFIETYPRDWTYADKLYFRSYYLNSDILDLYEVDSLEGFYLYSPYNRKGEESELYQSFKHNYLAFSYHSNGYYKLYQPHSLYHKWVSNIPHKYYQGYPQLPEKGEYCIVTKSLKDVMALYRMGVPAVAPQAESSIISLNGYHLLINRFPRLFTLYDWAKSSGGVDRTGLRGAFGMRDKYQITPLFLTNGRYNTINYKSKDFSDFLKTNGPNKTEYLIKTTVDRLMK